MKNQSWKAVVAIATATLLAGCERHVSPPAAVANEIALSFLSSREGKFCASAYTDCTLRELSRTLIAREVDLNDDGQPEYLIESTSAHLCGNRSCVRWVYRKTATGYEAIGDDFGEPQKQTSFGYRDMLEETNVFPGLDGRYLYRFEGHRYELAGCWERDTARKRWEPCDGWNKTSAE